MTTDMKKCTFRGEQEKCPQYEARCAKPGKVDLRCLDWRDGWLGTDTSICTCEFDVAGPDGE